VTFVHTFTLSLPRGSSRTFEEGGDVPELRDAPLPVATVPLQLLQCVQELAAGRAGVHAPQRDVHLPPVVDTHTHTHTRRGHVTHVTCICIDAVVVPPSLTMWRLPLWCIPPSVTGPPCGQKESMQSFTSTIHCY